MRTSFIIISLCLISLGSSCQDTISNQELLKMFKQINKSDKSQRRHPEARQKNFINNFIEIKQLIENQGFVNVDSCFHRSRHKKIIEKGIRRTFTHILQTEPSLILNDNFIELICNELESKRFCKDYLIVPISVYVYDNEIKRPFKGALNKAIKVWGISESEITHSSP